MNVVDVGVTLTDGNDAHVQPTPHQKVYLIQNPKPWDNKTDTWLLYFTGYAKANPLSSRVVGVAYSPTLKGPWAIWQVSLACIAYVHVRVPTRARSAVLRDIKVLFVYACYICI